MGFQTQSPFSGQAYSMASMNSLSPFGGGSSRQAYPLPFITEIGEMPLTSQKSIYSLTLEEFQNTLGEPGKSFGSMNMEELLKNIWTAEEGQAMAAVMGTADVAGTGISKQASLQRQGSLSVRGAIGRKTVDEVWKSVYQGPINIADSPQLPPKQRELTFGEVTLEDFLVKAGIVSEEDTGRNTAAGGFQPFEGNLGMDKSGGNQFGAGHGVLPSATIFPSMTSVLAGRLVDHHQGLQIDATPVSLQPADLLIGSYPNAGIPQHGQLFRQSPTPGAGNVFSSNSGKQAGNGGLIVAPMGLGGLGSPVRGGIAASLNASASYGGFNNPLRLAVPTYKADSPLSQSSDGMGTSQGSMPLSPVFQSGLNGPLRKRLAEGPVEMVVERRQRRMIKNRESATRSRARKQAYTVELENELTELRAENTKLKQKQEKAEKQMKKVIATTQEIQKEDKVLRRTRTGPW